MNDIDSLKDFAAVIDAFGGPLAFAEAVGIPASHARTMKARNSISADYWPQVVSAAEKRSPAITLSMDLLGKLRTDLARRRAS